MHYVDTTQSFDNFAALSTAIYLSGSAYKLYSAYLCLCRQQSKSKYLADFIQLLSISQQQYTPLGTLFAYRVYQVYVQQSRLRLFVRSFTCQSSQSAAAAAAGRIVISSNKHGHEHWHEHSDCQQRAHPVRERRQRTSRRCRCSDFLSSR